MQGQKSALVDTSIPEQVIKSYGVNVIAQGFINGYVS